jgi:hypothetical protein
VSRSLETKAPENRVCAARGPSARRRDGPRAAAGPPADGACLRIETAPRPDGANSGVCRCAGLRRGRRGVRSRHRRLRGDGLEGRLPTAYLLGRWGPRRKKRQCVGRGRGALSLGGRGRRRGGGCAGGLGEGAGGGGGGGGRAAGAGAVETGLTVGASKRRRSLLSFPFLARAPGPPRRLVGVRGGGGGGGGPADRGRAARKGPRKGGAWRPVRLGCVCRRRLSVSPGAPAPAVRGTTPTPRLFCTAGRGDKKREPRFRRKSWPTSRFGPVVRAGQGLPAARKQPCPLAGVRALAVGGLALLLASVYRGGPQAKRRWGGSGRRLRGSGCRFRALGNMACWCKPARISANVKTLAATKNARCGAAGPLLHFPTLTPLLLPKPCSLLVRAREAFKNAVKCGWVWVGVLRSGVSARARQTPVSFNSTPLRPRSPTWSVPEKKNPPPPPDRFRLFCSLFSFRGCFGTRPRDDRFIRSLRAAFAHATGGGIWAID